MRTLLILCISLLLLSCENDIILEMDFLKGESIAIHQLLKSPVDYSDKNILIKGITSEIIKTPLGSMYLLTDETGSIWVKTNHLPKRGRLIFLKATVENIFLFRKYSLGLHLIEIDRGIQ